MCGRRKARVRLKSAQESCSACWYNLEKTVDICHNLEITVIAIGGGGFLLNKVVQEMTFKRSLD